MILRQSERNDNPDILLVNPWIHDFAAYDFWAKPLGLLMLASLLRDHGFSVTYLDCLDRFHPRFPQKNPTARHGRGPYHKTRIEKPRGFEDIPRNFSRYGIPPECFRADLQAVPSPDIVFVTSLMTYWYPGVQETIAIIREVFPSVPVILGGIYATLCEEHAVRYSGADQVVTGSGESQVFRLIEKYTGVSVRPQSDPDDLNTYPYPAFDLQRELAYVPILTSVGCPFSCVYCASHFLNPRRMVRDPEKVVSEIGYWHHRHGVRDFVFYDDALLTHAEAHAIPMLESIIRAELDIRFHTPNAVHIRSISEQVAGLMFRAGFTTLRLGLETAAFENRNLLDRKVTAEEFARGVSHLKHAGFTEKQIGAYLLAGLPDQDVESLEYSIGVVKKSGITPVLAYYTPIPHTALWDQAVACSRYDLEADPVFTNNAVLPCWHERFSWEKISYLKNLTKS